MTGPHEGATAVAAEPAPDVPWTFNLAHTTLPPSTCR
jgi:hypothetical protein